MRQVHATKEQAPFRPSWVLGRTLARFDEGLRHGDAFVITVTAMPLAPRELTRFSLQDDPAHAKGPRGQLLRTVGESSFSIESIVDKTHVTDPRVLLRGDSFGFFLKPNNHAKLLYGLDREVLLWCSTYPSFQARDIEALKRTVEESGSRLSRLFMVLVTKYDPASRSSLESESDLDQSLVHISIDELHRRGLDALLSRHLYSRDLFDVKGATVRAVDFFGRREMIDRIVSEVETGTSQTGVFGLRKMGKTSLLNRLSDRLQNAGKTNAARLDLQWTTSINPDSTYTLWALGESLFASHRSVRSIRGYRLFGTASSYSDIADTEHVWEWFAHDVRLLLTDSKRNTCVLIDEIERMYERPEERGFVRFWRLLRGLDQQFPGRLRYVIGGTSPQCAEMGTVAGEDNPLFNYLNVEYLGPLSSTDASALLTTLGGRMGLGFTKEAASWTLDECGGHPALLRALGSAVHQQHIDRLSLVEVSEPDLRNIATQLGQRGASVLDQMLAALQDQYPTEFELLEHLSSGQLHQYRELAELFPSEVQHLRSYGLLEDRGTPRIPIRQLHTHLINQARVRSLRPSNASEIVEGEMIGPWKVVSCLASGNFATVYEVSSEDANRTIVRSAAKVLKMGNLSALQREVDILKELNHPNIVQMTDALRTDGGAPCLIMELLTGKELSYYCTPSTSPSTRTWLNWISQVLDALQSMHPRLDEVRDLATRENLTSAEYSRWDQARHGYVHRDIKPENIMITLDRGPVLIDFNIAVRAGAPVETTSSTPGYFPMTSTMWEPTHDLYALGVSFLEVAAGVRLANASLPELMEITRGKGSPAVLQLVDELMKSPETGMTASEARKLALQIPRH